MNMYFEKIKSYVNRMPIDVRTGKRILFITIITALFILILSIQNDDADAKYIIDESGNVTGILRESPETSEEYILNLTVIDGSKVNERTVRINKQATEDGNSQQRSNEENQAVEREAELTRIITEIELSSDSKTTLPVKLSDGTRLKWSLEKRKVSGYLFIPLIYICLVFLVIKSGMDSEHDLHKEHRQSILMALPRFTNQLLLMLNAGMILPDAIERICEGYKSVGSFEDNFFENELVNTFSRNMDHRTSTAQLLSEFARINNVKEMMRISTILTENERRGSNVIDNLSRESRYLWDDRIIIARERGKMIDTRMSYPLAVLLILLIVITMAPALLNL